MLTRSSTHLILFVLIFAGAGTYLLWPTHATSTNTAAIYTADFEGGSLSPFSPQMCGPNALSGAPIGESVVTSPVRAGQYADKIVTDDTSVSANCGNGSPQHPNANANIFPKDSAGQPAFAPGQDWYMSFSYLLPPVSAGNTCPASSPDSIPTAPCFPHMCYKTGSGWVSGCFFQLEEVYGLPFGGPPPVSTQIMGTSTGNVLQTNGTWLAPGAAAPPHGIWQTPNDIPQDGRTWIDLVIHEHFGTCGGPNTLYPCASGQTQGSLEIWYGDTSGQHPLTKQTNLYDPVAKTYSASSVSLATLAPDINWPGCRPTVSGTPQCSSGCTASSCATPDTLVPSQAEHLSLDNYRGATQLAVCDSAGNNCQMCSGGGTCASSPALPYNTSYSDCPGYCYALQSDGTKMGVVTTYADEVRIGLTPASVAVPGSTPPAPPPPAPAPTVILTASPTTVTSGQSSTLTWSSTNATSCSAPWTGSANTAGTQPVSPTANTTYTMTCIGGGGSGSKSVSVSVTGAPLPPSGTGSSTSTSTGSGTSVSLSSSTSTPPTVSGIINLNTGGKSATCAVDGSQTSCSRIDTTQLADGTHTITAQVTEPNGTVVTEKKTIVVNNHHSLLKNLQLRYGTVATVAMVTGSSVASVALLACAAWVLILRRRLVPLHDILAHTTFLHRNRQGTPKMPVEPSAVQNPGPTPGTVVEPEHPRKIN